MPLRWLAERRLCPEFARLASACVLVMALVLGAAMFEAVLYVMALASPMASAVGFQPMTLGLVAAASYLTRAAIRG
jgi:hypothetical protein